MYKNITTQNNDSVTEYINSLDDEQAKKDSFALIEIMQKVSGHPAKMWGTGIIGFDTHHFKYPSGHEGDIGVLGFSPRKGKLVVYLADGVPRHEKLLEKLGKHTSSKVCVYIKHLSDIDISVLTKIIEDSYKFMKSSDGEIYKNK